MNVIKKTILTQDGITLRGTLFEPKGSIKAVVQINPGTGTKTEFYAPYAKFLAENGYAALIWNYRGICESRSEDLSGVNYCFLDVGLRDIPAVTAHLKELYPSLPLYCVGHSVGGQQIGLSSNSHFIEGLVAVAVSVGYLGYMPLSYRMQAYFFFEIFARASVALKGYVAAKRFGLMEDLPREVVQQWRDWCHRPDYFFDQDFYGKVVPKGHYQDFRFPIEVFTATDDPISNRRSVPRFWSHIQSQKGIHFHWYKPAEIGRKSIGHFGYFRSENREIIWEDTLKALERFRFGK